MFADLPGTSGAEGVGEKEQPTSAAAEIGDPAGHRPEWCDTGRDLEAQRLGLEYPGRDEAERQREEL